MDLTDKDGICANCGKELYRGRFGERFWEPDYKSFEDVISWRHVSKGYAACSTSKFAEPAPLKPLIVCLCGSTKFIDAFRKANLEKTIAGEIVLSIGCDTKSDADLLALGELSEEAKIKLDELHKRKIDLCDYVYVVSDESGYYGESTKSEIVYARSMGRPVTFMIKEILP